MPTSLHRAFCVAALVALPLAACGGDDDPTTNGTATTDAPSGDALVVTALDSLAFDPDSLTAPAGTIDIELVNDGSLPHTFVVEDHEDDLKLTVGSTDEGTIDLEAGEYTFYCDIPGHRGAGMEGTLTVE